MNSYSIDFEIGKRLSELQEILKFRSSRAFAEELNIDPSQFHKMQKGQKGFKIESCLELYSKHEVDLNWLFSGEGEPLLSKVFKPRTPFEAAITAIIQQINDELQSINNRLYDLDRKETNFNVHEGSILKLQEMLGMKDEQVD